jgi:hypothetical protein
MEPGDNDAADLSPRMQGASKMKDWTHTLAFAFAFAARADPAIELKQFLQSQAGLVMGTTMHMTLQRACRGRP